MTTFYEQVRQATQVGYQKKMEELEKKFEYLKIAEKIMEAANGGSYTVCITHYLDQMNQIKFRKFMYNKFPDFKFKIDPSDLRIYWNEVDDEN